MKRFYIALGMFIAIVAFSIYGHIAVMKALKAWKKALNVLGGCRKRGHKCNS